MIGRDQLAVRTGLAGLVAIALVPASSGAAPRAHPRAAATGAYDGYLAPASACPGNDAPTLLASEQVSAMLCLIDYARAQNGLPALERPSLLATSASSKADDIVNCDDFSHSACGKPMAAPFEQAGYTADPSAEVGENVAYGEDLLGSPRSIMRAWLESDGHRTNLLDERWREQGVASRKPPALLGLTANTVWVSHFGRRGGGSRITGSDPSAPASALHLAVRPRHARVGRRTAFRFVVTSGAAGARRAVPGARVAFASRRTVTNAHGQAKIVALLRRPGRYRAVASKGATRRTVTVLARTR